MSEHQTPHVVERRCDVLVVGGSVAALDAARAVGAQRRSVIVVDRGWSNGADASASGAGAAEEAREAVRRDGGELLAGRVTGIEPVDGGGVRATLTGGHAIVARRAVVLDGSVDVMPSSTALVAAVDGEVPTAAARAADDACGALDAEDERDPGRASGNERDWDHRYGGAQLWSGNPNGTLVHELRDVAPGRALDVGAGEGGDAVWLAEQGWHVTASDIARRGLDRVAAEAARRGLTIECLRADANAPGAYGDRTYDLVSAQYASIPRRSDDRGLRNVIGAVAPGGLLLVVGHDLAPMRTPIDTTQHSRMFDPDAYVRVDDVARAIGSSPDWHVETYETRPRPAGAASSHHVDDVVLRARRRTR